MPYTYSWWSRRKAIATMNFETNSQNILSISLPLFGTASTPESKVYVTLGKRNWITPSAIYNCHNVFRENNTLLYKSRTLQPQSSGLEENWIDNFQYNPSNYDFLKLSRLSTIAAYLCQFVHGNTWAALALPLLQIYKTPLRSRPVYVCNRSDSWKRRAV